MRRILPPVLALLVTTGPVLAHAHLVTAMPAADSTLPTSPSEIAIAYTEALEPKFSSIEVTSATGTRVDKGDLHIMVDAKHIAVSLRALTPGTYKVIWHATSVDTHKTEGTYIFTVSK